MTLRTALDRTILLMRDIAGDEVADDTLLNMLTTTRIALIADNENITSHSAQSAFVSAALLMGRSGHDVHLISPDCPLIGPQIPLSGGGLVESLLDAGNRMLPDVSFRAGADGKEYDLALALGDAPITVPAYRAIRLNADPWVGYIQRASNAVRWNAQWWPLGGMCAATLGATEAFKTAMWKLDIRKSFHVNLCALFATVNDVSFQLAPANTPYCREIGEFDCISGGAITNAALYILSRIPGIAGRTRIFDSEIPDLSNLNRYMLLLRSDFRLAKVHDLAAVCGAKLPVIPVPSRYSAEIARTVAPLADAILIGVDHIPSRWEVQRANPKWLGIGATSHWDAMASFHTQGLACAECLHPRYSPNDATIPTVAFVSFWAGLLMVSYFLRHRVVVALPPNEQYTYMTALRPENPFRGRAATLDGCRTCAVLPPQHPSRRSIIGTNIISA
jgi:hypothetical protein